MTDRYKSGLESEKEKKLSNAAHENVMKFYEINKKHCDDAYSYYKDYELNKGKYVEKPCNLKLKEFRELVGEKSILVLTANNIEEAIFLISLYDMLKQPIQSYSVKKYVYQVIKVGEYTIIHNHTERTGDEFTRRSINAATRLFQPSYIILLGICYGIDFKKHDLGDVFISETVHGFRVNFRDSDLEEEEQTFYEAETEFLELPDTDMISLIKSHFNYYQPTNDILGVRMNIIIGKMLSSNSLMSSKAVKTAVMSYLGQARPKPIGGEMEACGIFKSNYFEELKFKKWLVIKSVCDWGEKKNALSLDIEENDRIKDSIQAYAMTNACVVFKEILNGELLKEEI